MNPSPQGGIDSALVGEVQIILAEKRTALATLRTGIALFGLPLSVLSLLVATSKYYEPMQVLHFLLPLLVLCLGLVGLGVFLIVRSIRHIHRYDRMIRRLKRNAGAMSEFIE